MSSFASTAGSFSSAPFSPETLLKFTPLPQRIQHHLAKVYVALCFALSAVALGATVVVLPWFLSLVGTIGCTLGLSLTPATPANLNKRYCCLGGLALCMGSGLAPLVAMANLVDPSIIVTALLSSAAIFGCFTVSALTTPRRTYMFLGGYITSATLCLCILSLARVFFKFDTLLSIELYLGLLVLAAYVLYDTQLIVERAAAGQMDHLKHAAVLLIDLVDLFARIVVILMRNQEKREDSNRKKRKN